MHVTAIRRLVNIEFESYAVVGTKVFFPTP